MIFLIVIGLSAAVFIYYKVSKEFKKADCGSCSRNCSGCRKYNEGSPK